jgi:hypothetical protein
VIIRFIKRVRLSVFHLFTFTAIRIMKTKKRPDQSRASVQLYLRIEIYPFTPVSPSAETKG